MQQVRRSNEQRRQESTKAVLDAALSLFVSRGYTSTTTADIARQAGLTKGAVYFYFKDKLALLTELLARSERQLYREFFTKLEASKDPAIEKIIQFLNWLAKIAVDNKEDLLLPVLVSLEFHGHESPPLKAVNDLYDQMKKQLAEIIRQGQEDGSINKRLSAMSIVDVIMSFADGLLLHWYRQEADIDGATMARAARITILEGIQSK